MRPGILDREGKAIVAIPGLVRQQPAAGAEVLQCRGVSRGKLCAFTRDKIQFRNALLLRNRRDQMRATVELIDDLEDPFLKLSGAMFEAIKMPIRRCASDRNS